MSAFTEIVLSQTTMGPHTVGIAEVGVLVAVLGLVIVCFPHMQELSLIHQKVKDD
jgi:hypothetical protein